MLRFRLLLLALLTSCSFPEPRGPDGGDDDVPPPDGAQTCVLDQDASTFDDCTLDN